ncbi:MAG: NnrU family protein, partial [Pseudomonadota bacterium]
MLFLFLGLVIWYLAHLFKRIAPERRAAMGDKGKGLVALLLFGSVALMVLGYRGVETSILWPRYPWAVGVNNLLMVIAIYFVTPGPKKGALFYKMRHPMLTGFLIWVVAHLLVNGGIAAIILFGGLGIWAVLSMIVINQSEPEWTPGPKGTLAKDLMFLGAALVATGIIGYLHTFFGLSP